MKIKLKCTIRNNNDCRLALGITNWFDILYSLPFGLWWSYFYFKQTPLVFDLWVTATSVITNIIVVVYKRSTDKKLKHFNFILIKINKVIPNMILITYIIIYCSVKGTNWGHDEVLNPRFICARFEILNNRVWPLLCIFNHLEQFFGCQPNHWIGWISRRSQKKMSQDSSKGNISNFYQWFLSDLKNTKLCCCTPKRICVTTCPTQLRETRKIAVCRSSRLHTTDATKNKCVLHQNRTRICVRRIHVGHDLRLQLYYSCHIVSLIISGKKCSRLAIKTRQYYKLCGRWNNTVESTKCSANTYSDNIKRPVGLQYVNFDFKDKIIYVLAAKPEFVRACVCVYNMTRWNT